MPKQKRARRRWMPPAENKLQLKVALQCLRPPIWRRLMAPDNFTLGDLHEVIQIAMGWTNSHLHAFRIGSLQYGMAELDRDSELAMLDEESAPLRKVIRRKGQKFTYEYDFGDSWLHEIVVEKIEPSDEPHPRAVCLDGKRACPPEDCGGEPGYAHVLRVLKNASTPDDRELREWAGDYDQELFDINGVNQKLQGKSESTHS